MGQFAKALVCICLLVGLWGPPAAAQEAADARGAAGPLGKDGLLEKLRSLTRGSPPVSGFVVRGEDLVAILREETVPIRLEDCIVEDGLVFRDVAVVAVPLEFKNCEFRPAPMSRALWTGRSVDTLAARFNETVDFTRSTFVGPAVFADSGFAKRAIFRLAHFPDSANFAGVTFAESAEFLRARIGGVSFNGTTFEGRANFRIARFDLPADFGGAAFNHNVVFRNTVFEQDQIFGAAFNGVADFEEARFGGMADFRALTFPMDAHFTGAVFSGPADFAHTQFAELASFDDARFDDGVNLFEAVFSGIASYVATTFGGDSDFSGVRFAAHARFLEARFGGAAIFRGLDARILADFTGVDFAARAEFWDAKFAGPAIFGGARFGDGANFFEAEFVGNASFDFAGFEGESDFSEARFAAEASFQEAHFQGLVFFVATEAARFARFRGAVFDREVDFELASFGESADFKAAAFGDLLTLTSANLGAYADFRDARIAKLDLNSTHNPTILNSRIDMRGAQIADAQFQDVIFENTVDFSDATFGRPLFEAPETAAGIPPVETSIFRFVTFEDDVSFARARFAGRLAIENVKFQGRADFTDADFRGLTEGEAPSFSLSYVDFEDLLLDWPQLPGQSFWVRDEDEPIRATIKGTAPSGRREPNSRTLSELETRFRADGQLDDANAAYYYRKRAELREVRRVGTTGERVLAEAEWIFWGLICGYGTNLWWALGWVLLADLIFTLLYWSAATVTRKSHPENKEEFNFRLRLLDFPKQYVEKQADLPFSDGPLRRFVDSLRVSSVILFKIGYRDTTLDGRLGPLPIAYLVAVEWALGFYLMAALTVTLANTQPLINRLISGVF